MYKLGKIIVLLFEAGIHDLNKSIQHMQDTLSPVHRLHSSHDTKLDDES
jgi:hypothetical protein